MNENDLRLLSKLEASTEIKKVTLESVPGTVEKTKEGFLFVPSVGRFSSFFSVKASTMEEMKRLLKLKAEYNKLN